MVSFYLHCLISSFSAPVILIKMQVQICKCCLSFWAPPFLKISLPGRGHHPQRSCLLPACLFSGCCPCVLSFFKIFPCVGQKAASWGKTWDRFCSFHHHLPLINRDCSQIPTLGHLSVWFLAWAWIFIFLVVFTALLDPNKERLHGWLPSRYAILKGSGLHVKAVLCPSWGSLHSCVFDKRRKRRNIFLSRDHLSNDLSSLEYTQNKESSSRQIAAAVSAFWTLFTLPRGERFRLPHSKPVYPCFMYSSNSLGLCFPSSQPNWTRQTWRE